MNRVGLGIGLVTGAFALATPLAASAATLDYIDAYYIADSTLKIDDPALDGAIESQDGDGFGVKVALMMGERFFFAAEYDATENQDIGDTDLQGTVDTSRVGIGYNTTLPVYALVEYVHADYGFSDAAATEPARDSGFAASIGVKFDIGNFLALEARGGYIDIGDYDGFEYLGGLQISLDRHLALYGDYHVVDIENSDSHNLNTADVRAGLRFSFGPGGDDGAEE